MKNYYFKQVLLLWLQASFNFILKYVAPSLGRYLRNTKRLKKEKKALPMKSVKRNLINSYSSFYDTDMWFSFFMFVQAWF